MQCGFLSKLFQEHLMLCEPFEVSHLRHQALKLHEDILHQRGMYSILLYSLFCMLDQDNTLDVHICMYNRENIDPSYLGLHVHLGVLECSKANNSILGLTEACKVNTTADQKCFLDMIKWYVVVRNTLLNFIPRLFKVKKRQQ